ncbi:PdaC/SigV domain-containing protein [Sandaracinobacteroides saxicola]|uniref:DUF4163 domain-containing protein n=1 Tax=Sandaracinobacteroides saxicola TaxID=2759707 RepID=A0A7G5IE97_9SPHN|nr:DUF4163 domain-containing protein [Sandaracinobacteroides saxicola]QMW21689.1 DUF4163 domain-containing protein [Sandaracinobacteroides saxicola]
MPQSFPSRVALALILMLSSVPAVAQGPSLLIRERGAALDYRWTAAPEMVLAPALLKALRAEALKDLGAARVAAERDAAEARKGGFPVRRYTTQVRWTAEAETPRLLVFVASTYAYTGGAHGNSGTSALIWDRATQRRVAFRDLFSDGAAVMKSLWPRWCKALDEERAKRRGGAAMEGFSACPAAKEVTLVPTGSDLIWGVKVVADPYVAGPYAEGSYAVTLRLEDGELKLLKPAYKASFTDGD